MDLEVLVLWPASLAAAVARLTRLPATAREPSERTYIDQRIAQGAYQDRAVHAHVVVYQGVAHASSARPAVP